MADNQVEIAVITKTDLSEVEDLESLIEEVKSNAEEEVTLNVSTDETTANLEEAESEAETLSEELESIDGQTVSVNVDTSGIDEAKGSIDETKNSLEESASSADNLTTALAGIGATAAIENMVTTADNINTSWNRLQLTFDGTGVSMDTLKEKSSALSEATGRSGGVIRGYFNQMGIAGVTNTELLTSSFEALSGKAYQTGNSIETMESALQRVAMSGQVSDRLLRTLGLSTDKLAQSMGMSAEEAKKAFEAMTPEERIAAITRAMGDGTEANEMYKNSYAGLKDRANAAMAGLAGAVGQAILPIVIPALEAATNFVKLLTDGFKSLPGPVQGAIGAVLGIVAIGTTLIGTLGMVGKVIGTVKTGLETIGMLGKITSVISSISGAFSSLWGVIIANPILLVVVAIVALIAALIWAYYNVDWFREMVDNAWASIQEFAGWISGVFMGAIQGLGDAFNNAGQIIQSSIQGAVDFVMSSLQGLWTYITTLGGLIPENASITGNSVIDTVLKVMAFLWTLPMQIGMIFINIIAQALGFGENFTQTMITNAMNSVMGFIQWISQLPGRIASYFNNMISNAISFGVHFVQTLWQKAQEAVQSFSNAIQGIPKALENCLNWAYEIVMNNPLVGALQWLGEQAANAFAILGLGQGSPGKIYRALKNELDWSKELVDKSVLPDSARELGDSMSASFVPVFEFDDGEVVNGSIQQVLENSTGSDGQTIEINLYGDVDSEERLNYFVERIRRELSWNNRTAGRGV